MMRNIIHLFSLRLVAKLKTWRRPFILLVCIGILSLYLYTSSVKPLPRQMSFRLASAVASSKSIIYSTMSKTAVTNVKVTNTSTTKIPYSCPFPVLDPFDPSIAKYITKYRPLTCNGKPSVAYLDGDVIRINETKVMEKNISLQHCHYSPLKLASKGNDMELEDLKWSSKFKTSQEIPPDLEHLVVQCERNTQAVAQTFLSRILEKPEVERRSEGRYAKHVKENSPAETLSVMLVGVDGMSKQNFIRTMPKTREYILETMNAKELNMFNKIGDNTFGNVVALLTGRTESEFYNRKGWNMRKNYFDLVDHWFIWNAYQKAGYRTASIFDETGGTAFHYLKMGWKNPPFDYYHRPVPLALERLDKKNSNCAGDQRSVSLLLDYYLQLTTNFNTKTKPYFAYSFFTKLSHDSFNKASMGDEMYLEFFTKLHNNNLLNNTVFIFFSDHGPRFSPMRATYNGLVEGRTPYIFFIFPSWFETRYQEEMKVFQTNQNRLTTFFDAHATLQDILHFKGKKTKDRDALRGTSLFQEIPRSRTCQDAHIPKDYCVCKELSKEEIPEHVKKELALRMVDIINEKTEINRDMCEKLSLKTIYSLIAFNSNEAEKKYYQVHFGTKPGGGDFEVLLSVKGETNLATLEGDIVRYSFYRGRNEACADSLHLKFYCACKKSN